MIDVHNAIAAYREWDRRPSDPFWAIECEMACSRIARDLGVNSSHFRALIQQRRREGYDIETILLSLVENLT
jgi:hypothetical protein